MFIPFAIAASLAQAAPAATPCELHIWGGERLSYQTAGFLSELGLIGSLIDRATRTDDDRAARPRLAETLDTQGQVTALTAQPLTILLSIGDRRIVPHDLPLDPREAARRQARQVETGSPCYTELVVTGLSFHQSATLGRSFRTTFLYRDFSAAAAPHFTYSGAGETRLQIFPPAHEGDADAARRELISAFRANFRRFAQAMVAERTRRLERNR